MCAPCTMSGNVENRAMDVSDGLDGEYEKSAEITDANMLAGAPGRMDLTCIEKGKTAYVLWQFYICCISDAC